MQPSHLDARESANSALLTYLQASVEIDKASLAKELHDNLGGLIVAAAMDVAWAEEHSSSLTSRARGTLARAREALRSALDINRRIIEELRPSLLDNVGLFAALSWELKQVCARTGLRCSGHYPPSEMHFTPEASITLFRIAQEALAISNTHSSVTTAELLVSTDRETITLRFVNDEIASPPVGVDHGAAVFASMLHRIRVLGGKLEISPSPSNGTAMTITIPLTRILLART
jgi:signal transduction histidine kinase